MRDIILGKKALPSTQDRQADIEKWCARMDEIGPYDIPGRLAFQTDYIAELQGMTDYPKRDYE